MKNLITVIAVLFTAQFFAQTHEIIKHNGEKLDVNFIKFENNLVHYALPNSMEEHKISRYAVAQLTEKSKSNSKVISEKIDFSEKPDYKKVVVLKESETIGLKKAENLIGYLDNAKGETRLSRSEIGKNRLKEKAASKGHQFIVITSNKIGDLKAVAYTY
ncbi:hypothetical protein SAMN05443549_10692 [Flavobacterium fluvii]|uniref:Uncharacterized protein n=1 Tax=Flavobacterium fluvii TaxID=468056 RepID=A0A1M5M9X8_9FLAO|nr:hypothetical protein [Flavobacterium fluvii]SHG74061.1 hypothetical protein SAMN05443549_10692 [Flavobacterium fluvii]